MPLMIKILLVLTGEKLGFLKKLPFEEILVKNSSYSWYLLRVVIQLQARASSGQTQHIEQMFIAS